MARVKFSSIVADVAGSIGGATFQKNGYGSTLRSKPINSKTRTAAQSEVLAGQRAVIGAWKALTAAQRKTWDAFVDYAPHYAWNNANSLLSGYNLFLQYNGLRVALGMSIVTSPSFAAFNMPAPTLSISLSGGNLTFLYGVANTTYNFTPIVKLSAPIAQSSGMDLSSLRLMQIDLDNITEIRVTSSYLSYFGRLPVSGEYVRYSFQVIGDATPNVLRPVFGILQAP